MAAPKLYRSYNWMRRKFIVERLSEEEIAKLANTTQVTVNTWLKKHGLRRPAR